ncbi:hypothetical protein GCM10009762_09700 [Dermacoccus barathri]|uniref:DUF1707 domain-containing protein n=1 Tax=Dermacoccus barathri TaxID=322601 RepID=A0ABN2BEB7_9MICO
MNSEPRRKYASEMTHEEFVEALRRARLDPTPVDVDNLKLSPFPKARRASTSTFPVDAQGGPTVTPPDGSAVWSRQHVVLARVFLAVLGSQRSGMALDAPAASADVP